MIVALLASARFGVSRIAVRLHDAGHAEALSLIRRNHVGDLEYVNPEQAAVDRIAALLAVHGAVDVVSFMDAQLAVAGFRITESSDFFGLRVSDMNLLFAATPTLAVAIRRMDDWIIPGGDEEIRVGDLVYFAIARDHLSDVLTLVGVKKDQRRDVMIAGAGPIGLELARRLEAHDAKVVLIEEDETLAREASEALDDAMVIHGRPTDQSLLEEEEISRVASFVAVTRDHETNLVAGLLAKRLGAGRAIVLVDNPALVDLVGQIGIDAIISPRVLAIGLTLEIIRGRRVRSVAQLLEDRIEIVEFEAAKRSRVTSEKLSDVKLPPGVLVAALRRGEKLLVPRGSDRVEAGDRVLFITTSENAPKLADFLSE
jgi:trk system potassium uptake protein TrkA